MENKHNIYIVLTYSGTVLSRLVKGYTRKEYSHVSISLNKNLNPMYSFGRLNPYTPLFAGIVKESTRYGFYKRFKNTKSRIYTLQVTTEEYNKLKENIDNMYANKKKYRFNMLGLMAVPLHLKVHRNNHFYCAEFVKYVLENSVGGIELPEIIKPEDFEEIKGLELIYTGVLRKYKM